jgi:hypothetical protein
MISVSYKMLLGQYSRNRKEIRKKEGRLIKNLREARKGVSEPEPIPTEGKEGFWAGTLDLFGNDIVSGGGIEVLESLFLLDAGTLAALIEWNRINLLRIEQKLLIRRCGVLLIAGLSAVAPLAKVNLLGNPNVVEFLRIILVHGLLRYWRLNVLFVGLGVAMEVLLWRPGKLRIEEFGQMLAVAFAYVSKMPNPQKDKIEQDPNDGKTEQVERKVF